MTSNLSRFLLAICFSFAHGLTFTTLAFDTHYNSTIAYHGYAYFRTTVPASSNAGFMVTLLTLSGDADLKIGTVQPTTQGSFQQVASSSTGGLDEITVAPTATWYTGVGQTIYVEVYGYYASSYSLIFRSRALSSPSSTRSPSPLRSPTASVSPLSPESAVNIAQINIADTHTGYAQHGKYAMYYFILPVSSGFTVRVNPLTGGADPDLYLATVRPASQTSISAVYSSSLSGADSISVSGGEAWFTGRGQVLYLGVYAYNFDMSFTISFTMGSAVSPSPSVTSSPLTSRPPAAGAMAVFTPGQRVQGSVGTGQWQYFEVQRPLGSTVQQYSIILTAISGDPDLYAGSQNPLSVSGWHSVSSSRSGSDSLLVTTSSTIFPAPGRSLYIGIKGYSSSTYSLEISVTSGTPQSTLSPTRSASRTAAVSSTASRSPTQSASISPDFAPLLSTYTTVSMSDTARYFRYIASSAGTYQLVVQAGCIAHQRIFSLAAGTTGVPPCTGCAMEYVYSAMANPCDGPSSFLNVTFAAATPGVTWYFELRRTSYEIGAPAEQFGIFVSLISGAYQPPAATPSRPPIVSTYNIPTIELAQLGHSIGAHGWVSTSAANTVQVFVFKPWQQAFAVSGFATTAVGQYQISFSTAGGSARVAMSRTSPMCSTCSLPSGTVISSAYTSYSTGASLLLNVGGMQVYDPVYIEITANQGAPTFLLSMYKTSDTPAPEPEPDPTLPIGAIIAIAVGFALFVSIGLTVYMTQRRRQAQKGDKTLVQPVQYPPVAVVSETSRPGDPGTGTGATVVQLQNGTTIAFAPVTATVTTQQIQPRADSQVSWVAGPGMQPAVPAALVTSTVQPSASGAAHQSAGQHTAPRRNSTVGGSETASDVDDDEDPTGIQRQASGAAPRRRKRRQRSDGGDPVRQTSAENVTATAPPGPVPVSVVPGYYPAPLAYHGGQPYSTNPGGLPGSYHAGMQQPMPGPYPNAGLSGGFIPAYPVYGYSIAPMAPPPMQGAGVATATRSPAPATTAPPGYHATGSSAARSPAPATAPPGYHTTGSSAARSPVPTSAPPGYHFMPGQPAVPANPTRPPTGATAVEEDDPTPEVPPHAVSL